MFLVPPLCVHRDRRPDLHSKRRPFTTCAASFAGRGEVMPAAVHGSLKPACRSEVKSTVAVAHFSSGGSISECRSSPWPQSCPLDTCFKVFIVYRNSFNLSSLVCLALSMETRLEQAAPLVMARRPFLSLPMLHLSRIWKRFLSPPCEGPLTLRSAKEGCGAPVMPSMDLSFWAQPLKSSLSSG